MYEENEKKVDWGNIIKRLLMLLIALLVIFGIITLVTKCANSNKNKGNDEPISLSEQLDALQNATLNYLTKDNLPTELNASKTIRLKYLISKNLIEEIKDSEGNTCDENTSYSEVTKLANNYAVKLTLSCGDNSEYRIIYVGCFENCEGGICLGEENSTGGVCDVTVPEPTPTEEPSTNTTTNTNTSTNTSTTKPSTSTTTKPSTNTNTTTKPSTSTTTKPSTNTNSGSK